MTQWALLTQHPLPGFICGWGPQHHPSVLQDQHTSGRFDGPDVDQFISNKRSMAPDVPFSNSGAAPGPPCLLLCLVNADALPVTGSLSRARPVLPELHLSLLSPEHLQT